MKRFLWLFFLVLFSLVGICLYLNKAKKSCTINIQGKDRVCGEAVISTEIFTSYLVNIEKAYISEGINFGFEVIIDKKSQVLYDNTILPIIARSAATKQSDFHSIETQIAAQKRLAMTANL